MHCTRPRTAYRAQERRDPHIIGGRQIAVRRQHVEPSRAGQCRDYPVSHRLCERRVAGFRVRAYEGKNDQTYWFAYGVRRQWQGAFAERAQCRGRQLTITSPILAGEVAEVAETVHTGGRRYVSFGVVVAQGVTCRLQPQMAVERDGRLSSEALELPAQRALGGTGSGGDFAGSERSGEVALHEPDGHRNASRGRTCGPSSIHLCR